MEWVAAVAAPVGLGVLAGWIYAGFPGLRKGRRHDDSDPRLLVTESPPGGSISSAQTSPAIPVLTRSLLSSVRILPVIVLVAVQLMAATQSQAVSGDLDPTFGMGGRVTTDFGGDDSAHAVALQDDGKVVAAGIRFPDFALARYNSDGTVDSSFGTEGKITSDFRSINDEANAVAVQPDGKIVAAGTGHGSEDTDFALARYNIDGTLDTSFGSGGKVTTDFFPVFAGSDQAFALALQEDDKIVAPGIGGGRLNPEPSGALGDWDFALARYNTDGTLDPTFGTLGKVTTDVGDNTNSTELAFALALQGDGKLVAAVFATIGSRDDFALARYNVDGSLDASFGTGGKVTGAFSVVETAE